MEISGYNFEGPYAIDATEIPSNRAAVYVIICKTSESKYYVKDVGESGEVGIRIGSHDRRPCWESNCNGTLSVYLLFMASSSGYSSEDRRKVENKIIDKYKPPCGDK